MSAKEQLAELTHVLRPGVTRARALAQIDEMFRKGSVPDPLPDGFCPGTLITTSIGSPLDSLARSIADAWMPWKGKAFNADRGMGVNIMDTSARLPARVVWPSYTPESVEGNRMEMFPFHNRVSSGALDDDVKVYKIDYDFDANPGFIIRRILDEIVEVDDGFYLGKILFRLRTGWRPIGFFTLQRPV